MLPLAHAYTSGNALVSVNHALHVLHALQSEGCLTPLNNLR